MAAGGWGLPRVAKPAQPVSQGGLLSQIMRNQRADDRRVSDRQNLATPSADTIDWTFDVYEPGVSGGWAESYDLAAGGWGIALNAKVAVGGTGWTGVLTDLVCSIGTSGDYAEGHGSVFRFYRLSAPATINLVQSFAGGVDATVSITASFSKLYDL